MNKVKAAALFSTLVLSAHGYAGDMGPAVAPANSLFTSVEGAYTWDSVGSTVVNGFHAHKTKDGWGGRLAAGAIHHSTYSNWLYTAEMGWGYYSKTSISAPLFGINADNYIYGLDLLVGAGFAYNQFDFFLKAGGMIQDVRMVRRTNLSSLVVGGNVVGTSNTTLTTSSVVPEIKVGGAYNFNEHLALTLAYMYVFGNDNVSTRFTRTFNTDTFTSTSSVTGAPIALSSVMFGLRYTFA